MLAAAAGDSLGWPQEERGGLVGGKRARLARRPTPEFSSWHRNSGTRFARYQETVDAGDYSDDTQLMLAVARSCLVSDDWERYLTQIEFPSWPTYQRGGGRAVLRAANSWADKVTPWRGKRPSDTQAYFEAGANGVAMRIAPHVIWATARGLPMESLLERVVRDGVLTHGHPRALIGAMSFASSLAFALQSEEVFEPESLVHAAESGLIDGRVALKHAPHGWLDSITQANYVEQWNSVNAEMYGLLATARRSLRQGSMSNVSATLNDLGAIGKYSGSGTASAAAAIYLASRAGTRPISGLLQAAFEQGADTDTLASMTGSLLGAIHGSQWLGDLHDVQDASYLARLASALVEGVPLLPPVGRSTTQSLYIALDRGGESGTFIDGRKYQVIKTSVISQTPVVSRFRLHLEDGQSVIVDRMRRNSGQKDGTSTARSELGAPSSSGSRLPANPDERREGVRDKGVIVSLGVTDLKKTVSFYERLVEHPLERTSAGFRLTGSVRFEVLPHSDTLSLPDGQVSFTVSDIRGFATRIGEKTRVSDALGTHLQLIDPDGRTVIVTESDG
ncbi:ADP-ribosylglycohydrolase family protein [Leifsonia sp. RAF41]|uniref:ADP-ribosylglycohydrolase family protein n=1 Tax=Leifsonia sp. RAF41 TaxID=3233056 RepID=UPI003F97BA4B